MEAEEIALENLGANSDFQRGDTLSHSFNEKTAEKQQNIIFFITFQHKFVERFHLLPQLQLFCPSFVNVFIVLIDPD